MPAIPAFVLKKLYVKGSLRADRSGFYLELKNVIAPAVITGLASLTVDGEAVEVAHVTVTLPGGKERSGSGVSAQSPLQFPVGSRVGLSVSDFCLQNGPHQVLVRVVVKEVGPLDIPISDELS